MNQSFATAKFLLVHVATLVHPDPAAWVSLSFDASSSQVGTVLQACSKRYPAPGPLWRSSQRSYLPQNPDTPSLTEICSLPTPVSAVFESC